MSRRKKTIAEMEAEKSKLELKVSDANQEIRKLNKKISEEKRKARNARIYQRGGELTHLLQDNTELLTDDDVKQLLTFVFSLNRVKKLVADVLAIRRGEQDGSAEALLENAVASITNNAPFRNPAQHSS